MHVFNQYGEVHCRVKMGETICPGMVSMPKGAWRKASLNGQTANALALETLSFVGDGACFNGARVEVARI